MNLKITCLLLAAALLLGACAVPDGQPADTEQNPTAVTASGGETTQGEPEPLSREAMEAVLAEAVISEDSHPREEDYLAVFQTRKLSLDAFALHMEKRIYEEEQLRRCALLLWQDLAAAEQLTGLRAEKLRVYLVKETLTGGAVQVRDQIFCTPQQLEEGSVRDLLLGAAYDLPLPWQRAGLTECVFGQGEDELLRSYYADPYHAYTASCSPIFLSPLISDPETVLAARSTARCLTASLLEKGGLEALREAEDTAELLPALGEKLGLASALSLPPENRELAGMQVESEPHAICCVRIGNIRFSVQDSRCVEHPDGFYEWLCEYYRGMKGLMEQIGREAPSALADAETSFAQMPIHFQIVQGTNGGSWADYSTGSILLGHPYSVWHETVHLLLHEPGWSKEQAWMDEGIAEHLGIPPIPFSIDEYLADFESFLNYTTLGEPEKLTQEERDFEQDRWRLTKRLTEQNQCGSYEAWVRAMGICTLLCPEAGSFSENLVTDNSSVQEVRGQSNGKRKDEDPNSLSYGEAMVFLEYLGQRFGMDAAVNAIVNGLSVEKAFGIPYPSLYRDALEYYWKLYGSELESINPGLE